MKNLLFFIFFGFIASSPFAASFDCAKQSTNVERMICDDQYLNKLDETLAADYKTIKNNNVGARTISEMTKTQRDWIKLRNLCNDKICIRKTYIERLDQICKYATVVSGVFWGECLDASDIQ